MRKSERKIMNIAAGKDKDWAPEHLYKYLDEIAQKVRELELEADVIHASRLSAKLKLVFEELQETRNWVHDEFLL
jgi:hypothetical protein